MSQTDTDIDCKVSFICGILKSGTCKKRPGPRGGGTEEMLFKDTNL